MRLMSEHRLLSQSTSRGSAVVKLVPPLVIDDTDLDWIVNAFEESLRGLASGRLADLRGLFSMARNARGVLAREVIRGR
ncbi:MAG: hypothetical protein MK085_05405, partial [Phycisphaerales bacterium]|nr:hypothetical protein [Phycisphaerales bacterium]